MKGGRKYSQHGWAQLKMCHFNILRVNMHILGFCSQVEINGSGYIKLKVQWEKFPFHTLVCGYGLFTLHTLEIYSETLEGMSAAQKLAWDTALKNMQTVLMVPPLLQLVLGVLGSDKESGGSDFQSEPLLLVPASPTMKGTYASSCIHWVLECEKLLEKTLEPSGLTFPFCTGKSGCLCRGHLLGCEMKSLWGSYVKPPWVSTS